MATNLTGAHLEGADLSGAELMVAKLIGAHMSGANLTGASLHMANLTGAMDIAQGQLEQEALSLQGATMPDGTVCMDAPAGH